MNGLEKEANSEILSFLPHFESIRTNSLVADESLEEYLRDSQVSALVIPLSLQVILFISNSRTRNSPPMQTIDNRERAQSTWRLTFVSQVFWWSVRRR